MMSDIGASTAADGTVLVPVKVLSVSQPRLKAWRKTAPVEKGDTGFLDRSTIASAGTDRVFLVKKDAYLATFPGMKDSILRAGSAIRPLMKDGKYRILECSDDAGASTSYLFESISSKSSAQRPPQSSVVALPSDFGCIELVSLLSQHFDSLVKVVESMASLYQQKEPTPLTQLEMNDWGLVRLPTQPTLDGSDITEVSEDGSFVHYQGSDPIGSDTWVSPHTACALMKISAEWKKKVCPLQKKDECALQIGDIAFATPAKVKGSKQDPLGHLFHSSGECIDMRAFRKDRKRVPLNLREDPASYDQDLTKSLVSFLIAKKATPIYFNDASIYSDSKLGNGTQACDLSDSMKDRGNKVQPCPGHDNHIHFCLLPGDADGC